MLYGVLGDLHGPFIDERAVDLAFCVFEDLGITHLVLNGDILDFYNINAHGAKDPNINTNLDDEFAWAQDFLQEVVKRFKGVEIIFIMGNHEFRLDRFVMNNCPVFYNFLTIDKMLDLEGLGIEWIPYNERYQLGNASIYVQHSPPSYGVAPARMSLAKKIDEDHIWNCAHRTDMSVKTGSSGKIYTSYVNGWFGTKDIIEKNQREMPDNRRVFSYTKNHESWNCSFCLVSVDGKDHFVEQVLVKDYKCSVGGVLYEG